MAQRNKAPAVGRGLIVLIATLAVAPMLAGGAGGGVRSGAQPLSLSDCFLPQGQPRDDAVAFSCLHGVFPETIPAPAQPAGPVCLPLAGQRCPAWVSTFDDPGASGRPDQFPAGMAVSPDGALIAVSVKNVSFNELDPYTSTSTWAVVAYETATGVERWRSSFASGGPHDAPSGLAFSPDGRSIYVTGEVYIYGNPLVVPHDAVMTTIAFDSATGGQLWRASYDGAVGLDNGRVVATSPDGSQVYVAGVSDAGQGDLDYVFAGYAASSGATLWEHRYAGVGLGGLDSPFALGVNPRGGFVYLTGWSAGSAEFDLDYGTVAYAINGDTASVAWVARYDGIEADLPDEAFALGVDPAGGRVYVTGLSVGLAGATRTYEFGTVAYDALDGTELWRRRWNGSGKGFNSPTALAVDSAGGRVFVTGQSESPTTTRDSDVGTVSYTASSGAQLWAHQDGELTYDGEFALAIVASPDGSRVYATGVSSSSQQQGLGDQLTIAYGAVDGIPAWKARLNTTGLDYDIGTAVEVTPDGRRVVTSGRLTHGGIDPSGRNNIYDVGTAAYLEEGPTAVLVSSFIVRGRVVTWRTRTEAGIAGFELSRDGHRLTRRLIAAKGAAGGARYRFVDRSARARTHVYRLVAVGLDGTRTFVATARTG